MEPAVIPSIASRVIEHLENGLSISSETIAFAESALGITTFGEIGKLLTDPDAYGCGIIDLVFSPNHVFKEGLEPLVPMQGLSGDEVDCLCRHCAGSITRAMIRFNSPEAVIPVQITGALVRQFVDKLNLEKPIPFPGLYRCDHDGSMADAVQLRVMLRNAHYRTTPEHDAFLAVLIEHMDPCNGAGISRIECLDFIIGLLAQQGDDYADMFPMITRERRLYESMLEEINAFNDYYNRFSMEVLMCLNIRPPAATAGQLRKKIELLDYICLTAFGSVRNRS